MSTRVAELESLFTANIAAFDKGADAVERRLRAVAKTDANVVLTADDAKALAAMDRVEAGAKALDAATTSTTLDATPAGALGAIDRVQRELQDVDSTTVTAKVDADASAAEKVFDGLAPAGRQGGEQAGESMGKGIVDALGTLPIAGAVIGVGAVAAAGIIKALRDGLQVEVRADMLTARTGLDPAAVATIARISGEAYANNFGESIASNMDTARAAVQSGLLDPRGTARDAQSVVESLDGVATILSEDIPRVSRSAMQLLSTGLAQDAAGAFDIIVKGTQAGLNVSEDWLDTIDEYSTQFRKLGLEGPSAVGLLSQAVKAGARDTDTAADALKEFTIRAVDGSKLTADSFKGIGLNAAEMSAAIAAGGPTATAALDATLDRLRAVEDPALRAQLAVGLFGTKAEDLGDALYAMDLTTAVDELGQVAGAAKTAVDAMGDNAAGSIESARRNIEVAADGIKGALATAFSPQIEEFGTFVSENREEVIGFLLDLANGAIDFGRQLVNAAADGTEGFGDMVATVGPQVLTLIEGILEGLERIPGVDLDLPGFRAIKADAEDAFKTLDTASSVAADAMRENLIKNGLDPAQEKLNAVAIPMVAQAALHDASMRLAQDIDAVGYAADGSRLQLDTLNGTVDTSTAAGKTLDDQLRTMVASLDEEARKAATAGETQDALNQRYEQGRAALVRQLEQMGYTAEQAQALADTYGAVPGKVETIFAAETARAQADVDAYVARNDGRRIVVHVDTKGGTTSVNTGVGNTIGYAGGGYTGAGGTYEIAGPVHKREFVFDAETTDRNRALFEAIHAGADPASVIRSSPTAAAVSPGDLVGALREALSGVTWLVDGQPLRAIARSEAVGVGRMASGRAR